MLSTNDIYDGDLIILDEVLDVVGSNEFTDTLFSASTSGTINCMSGKPLKNLIMILTDTLGRDFKFITDNKGKFKRTKLLSGKYNLRFENLPLYQYSFDEYNTIIQDMTSIILGPSTRLWFRDSFILIMFQLDLDLVSYHTFRQLLTL